MIEATRFDDGSEGWKSERGAVRLTRPVPQVLLIRYEGFIGKDFADPIIEAVEQHVTRFAGGDVFIDTEPLLAYEPEFRTAITQAMGRVASRCGLMAIFMKSKLVAMAVTVMNLAQPGRQLAFSDRERFDRAVADAVRSWRQRKDAGAARSA